MAPSPENMIFYISFIPSIVYPIYLGILDFHPTLLFFSFFFFFWDGGEEEGGREGRKIFPYIYMFKKKKPQHNTLHTYTHTHTTFPH